MAVNAKWFSGARAGLEEIFGGSANLASYKHPEDDSASARCWQRYLVQGPDELVRRIVAGMNTFVNWELPGSVTIEIGEVTGSEGAEQMTLLVQVAQPPGRQDTKALQQLTVDRLFSVAGPGLRVKERWTNIDGVRKSDGGGQVLYRNLLPLYHELRVERITLDAKGMGAYVWATYGFVPVSDGEWVKVTAQIKQRLEPDLATSVSADTKTWIDENRVAIESAAKSALPGFGAALSGRKAAEWTVTETDREARKSLAEAFLSGLGSQAEESLSGFTSEDVIYAFLESLMPELVDRLKKEVVAPLLSVAGDRAWQLRTWWRGHRTPPPPEVAEGTLKQIAGLLDRQDAPAMWDLATLAADPGARGIISSMLQLLAPVWAGEVLLSTPATRGYQMFRKRIGYVD